MSGVYLHIPFCRVHCTYCAFAITTNGRLEEAYVDALLHEIALRADGRAVSSIYLGGGTPSRISSANVGRLLGEVQTRFQPAADCEITIEANPEDISPEGLEEWRRIGVNRISIGVQSFRDEELLPLGRVHSAEQASRAIADAVSSGMRTSLDLIAGLPRQTKNSLARNIDIATGTGAGHISLYMLDLEERTPLQVQASRGRIRLPEEDAVAEMYLDAVERLGQSGFEQYEISNFARAEEKSRHNLAYWQRVEYFGFGLGAHSFLGEARTANTRDIHHYIERRGSAMEFREVLGPEEQRRERLFLNLRQAAGLDYALLQELAGEEADGWVERGSSEGWLWRDGDRVSFTPRGFVLSSEYISQLF
ncbi:MAG TPA: radical SAM family heme chaperone HemW [Thermoanaerobaculia bacterium]|nr:radical SAM family heme chaperone HemW [Thermoanaerobaculia bacterium]